MTTRLSLSFLIQQKLQKQTMNYRSYSLCVCVYWHQHMNTYYTNLLLWHYTKQTQSGILGCILLWIGVRFYFCCMDFSTGMAFGLVLRKRCEVDHRLPSSSSIANVWAILWYLNSEPSWQSVKMRHRIIRLVASLAEASVPIFSLEWMVCD